VVVLQESALFASAPVADERATALVAVPDFAPYVKRKVSSVTRAQDGGSRVRANAGLVFGDVANQRRERTLDDQTDIA
jgi:hypothetical protein